MSPTHLLQAKSKAAYAIKVGAIISAVVILYHQDLALIFNEAVHSELASHILIVPFLFTYLVYRKRKILRAVIPLNPPINSTRILTHELPGGLLCFLAFVAYWQGSRSFYPLEYHLLSLPIFVAGCVLLLFNLETLRTLALPTAFLLFLTPPPIETIQGIGANLSTFTSQTATLILNLLRLPVTLTTEYGNPTLNLQSQNGPLKFTIDIACAGIYSLTGFTVFALFATYITRGRLWKKSATFLTGFPLIYALNILRVTLVVIIGYHLGQEIAMGVFHHFSGWILIFLGTLALLYLSEKIFKIRIFSAKSEIAQCSSCTKSLEEGEKSCFACGKLLKYQNIHISKQDLLKTATLLISLSMVLPLNVPVFTLTEGPVEIITQSPSGEQVSTEILPKIEGYSAIFLFRDKAFEKRAHQDASLLYMYTPARNSSTMPINVVLEIADSYDSVHRWEACILWPQIHGLSPTVNVIDRRDVQIVENPPTTGRFFAFQTIGSDTATVILYWYERGVFDTGSGAKPEYIKTSLLVYTDPEEYLEVEESLLPIAKTIVDYWQPVKTWPWLVVVLAAEGKIIMAITIVLLAAILAFQVHKKYEQRKSNLEAYNKLMLEQDKLVLLAVHQAAQENKAVGKTIASRYQKLTGKHIEADTLNSKLSQAEEAGFVRKEVASREDEPVIVWKSLISFPPRGIP